MYIEQFLNKYFNFGLQNKYFIKFKNGWDRRNGQTQELEAEVVKQNFKIQ